MAVVKKEVKEAVEKVAEFIDVELHEIKDGIHTIFLADGVVNFVNGLAKVRAEIADELKKHNFIK